MAARVVDAAFAVVYLRLLGRADVGAYQFLVIFTTYLDTVIDFGLNALVAREVARGSVAAHSAFRAVNLLRLGLWCVGLPVVAVVYGPLRETANLSPAAALAGWTFYLALLPTVLAKTATGLLWAAERLELTAAVSVVATLLRTVIGGAALFAGFGLVGLAATSALTNIVTALALWRLAARIPHFARPTAQPKHPAPPAAQPKHPAPPAADPAAPAALAADAAAQATDAAPPATQAADAAAQATDPAPPAAQATDPAAQAADPAAPATQATDAAPPAAQPTDPGPPAAQATDPAAPPAAQATDPAAQAADPAPPAAQATDPAAPAALAADAAAQATDAGPPAAPPALVEGLAPHSRAAAGAAERRPRVWLRESWPLFLNQLLQGLFFKVDGVLLLPLAGAVAGGTYAAAYKVSEGAGFVSSAFTLALFPRLSRSSDPATQTAEAMATAYRLPLRLLLQVAFPLAAGIALLAEPIVTVVAGRDYLPDSAVALSILICYLPLSYANGLTQYVLIAAGRQRLLTAAFVAALVFNVAANLVLIPRFGYVGAAWVTVASELVLLVPFARAAARVAPGVSLLHEARIPVLATLLMAPVVWWLRDAVHPVAAIAAGLAIYPLALWALGGIDARQIRLVRQLIRR